VLRLSDGKQQKDAGSMSMHGKRTQRLLGDEGFALVAVLMLLIGLSALAAAGYLSSDTDYRITQNHRASQRAFYVADAGLEHFMGQGKLVPDDTVTYNHPDGTVQVWATQVVSVDDSSTLFQLTSIGTHSAPEGGVSTRQLSTIVLHKAASIAVNAAITAPAGLHKNGVSGSVDGNDRASPSDCPVGGTENVAGLEVPPTGFSMSGGGKGKGGSPPGFSGNPAIDSTKTPTQMFQDMGINAGVWQGLRDGTFAEADYVVSTDGYPTFGTDVAADEWPVIVIDQSSYGINPAQSGRGTLVVYGDLDISGSFSWDGLILVGGEVISNGNNHIQGSVIAGLNLLLGGSPGDVELGNGSWDYGYHSCNVLNALKGIGWPVEEPGTWYEEF
jgi:hypothetical protein